MDEQNSFMVEHLGRVLLPINIILVFLCLPFGLIILTLFIAGIPDSLNLPLIDLVALVRALIYNLFPIPLLISFILMVRRRGSIARIIIISVSIAVILASIYNFIFVFVNYGRTYEPMALRAIIDGTLAIPFIFIIYFFNVPKVEEQFKLSPHEIMGKQEYHDWRRENRYGFSGLFISFLYFVFYFIFVLIYGFSHQIWP